MSKIITILCYCITRFIDKIYAIGRCHRVRVKLPNMSISPSANIDSTVSFESMGGIWQGGRICIGDDVAIDRGVIISPWMNGWIEIHNMTYIGPYTVIYGEGGVSIGPKCKIAGHCFIVASNHKFTDTTVPIRDQPCDTKGIKIGRDVWIGANCCILDGVELGDGCVIGAGSVVTKSVPPMAIAIGSPARVIRSRTNSSEK